MYMMGGGLTDDHQFYTWLSHLAPQGMIPWYLGDSVGHFNTKRNTQQRSFINNFYARITRWLARARWEIDNEIRLPLRKVM